MRIVRACHLASFTGNLGDTANHEGFRKGLASLTEFAFEFTYLEIRDFYWGNRNFDMSFVNYVNQFDVLIIGGGNYFELWVEGSPTGTSIALPLELFDLITCPIIFNALGVDPGQGIPDGNGQKFSRFISCLRRRGDLISVRNDGAWDNLRLVLEEEQLDGIYETVDAGFFVASSPTAKQNKAETYIAVNVACDMEHIRFEHCPMPLFIREIAVSLSAILEEHPGMQLVLVPHIYSDMKPIYMLLDCLSDPIRRTRVKVASLGSGADAHKEACELYENAALVLANRFHANVCALGLGARTLGLVNYVQIERLYEYLGGNNYCDVRSQGFSAELIRKVNDLLADREPRTNIIELHEVFDRHIANIGEFLRVSLGGESS